MARSRAPRFPRPARAAAGPVSPAVPSAAALAPRVWEGVTYRPLSDLTAARSLFDFAAVPWPGSARGAPPALAWGAFADDALVGAVAGEQSGDAVLLHGPVVVAGAAAREIASQLLAAALDHAVMQGAVTVFARPQGLDRVWVRFGFIPVPEGTLPAALGAREGGGLFAWRGGSALWSLREPERR